MRMGACRSHAGQVLVTFSAASVALRRFVSHERPTRSTLIWLSEFPLDNSMIAIITSMGLLLAW
jgi:hypothetical protein